MKRIREQVHAALKANPGATVDRLAELVGKPRNAVYQHLRRLRAAGRACNKGSTTGVLMAATRFAADRAGLNSPDQLGVRYVLTAADAGP